MLADILLLQFFAFNCVDSARIIDLNSTTFSGFLMDMMDFKT